MLTFADPADPAGLVDHADMSDLADLADPALTRLMSDPQVLYHCPLSVAGDNKRVTRRLRLLSAGMALACALFWVSAGWPSVVGQVFGGGDTTQHYVVLVCSIGPLLFLLELLYVSSLWMLY
jgi:hypothetical protein